MGWKDAPMVGEPARPASAGEQQMRRAVQLSPTEQARSDAFERSPGNMRELQAAIAKEKDPDKVAVLLAAQDQLKGGGKPKWASAPAVQQEAPEATETEIPGQGTPTAPKFPATSAAQEQAPSPWQSPGSAFVQGARQGGLMQGLAAGGRAAVAPLETAASVGTGATTGFLGGLLNAGNRIAQQITGMVQGKTAEQIKASGPSVEEAFGQGMQTGTYSPRIPEAQAQTEAIGGAMQEHGPALMGLGPELAALGKGVGAAARGARGLGVEGTLAAEGVPKAVTETVKTVASPTKLVSALTPGISPETAATVQKATKFGIDLPPDAFSKNKFAKLTGEAARNTPLGGAPTEANAVAFNKALSKRIGAEGSEKITPKVFGDAIERSGNTIGEITEANPIPEGAIQSTIEDFRKRATQRSGDVGNAVDGYLKELEAKAAENEGVVPGKAMKELLGQLGRDAYSSTDGNVRYALGELHSALTGDVAKVIGPEDAAALRTARQQYSDALMIAPLVNASGDISPAAFNQAFRKGRQGKLRAAKGTGGELGDLAEVAQYMKEPPSSMTAERQLIQKGIGLAATGGVGVMSAPAAVGGIGAANLYNRLGSKVLRQKAGPAPVEVPAEPTPATSAAVGEAAPAAPAPLADPRLAEIAKLRQASTDPAVRAALDAHEKTVQADIKAKANAAKQAASVDALEAAAKATQDPDLRATLQAQADKLRAEKIPVGEAKELTEVPVPKPEKVGKIPVGKAKELETTPTPTPEKTGPIPAGETTEITPEVVAPEEPIPVGEATDVSPVSNVPKAETYAHGSLFDLAEKRGIETRGQRPSEVRAAFEKSWAKEHGLNPMDTERAKNVARALIVDEKAVEAAVRQHEKSPRAFDRSVQDIIDRGTQNASETQQATGSGQGAAPDVARSAEGGAAVGRSGNANVSAEHPTSAIEPAGEQPGAHSAAAPGTNAESSQPRGQAGETLAVDKRGDRYAVKVTQEHFGADKTSKSILVEIRDPKTGERRGFVDFAVRDDGVLVAENAKVAPEFKKRGLAEMMYKAARDAGHDIAPGRVQTDEGHAMVESFRRKGLINKEAEGKRFRAGDLDLAPIEGESIPGEKATRPEPRGFERGARKPKGK